MAKFDLVKFNDFPNFRPCFTPDQMFTLGIAGGTTFAKNNRWTIPPEVSKAAYFGNNSKENYNRNLNRFQVEVPKKVMTKQSLLHITKHGTFAAWYAGFYYNNRTEYDREIIAAWQASLQTIWAAIAQHGEQNLYLSNVAPNLSQLLLDHGWDRAVRYPDGEIMGTPIEIG